jgi:ABC-type transport system involved in multi-copper enzyme maturation permease subunit
MRSLRDALVIALFDLGESLRSRKVLIFLALYVAGAVAATLMFTELLREIEARLAEQLLVARTDTPGSMTQAVMESSELHDVLAGLVRDSELASSLVRLPPIALLYGWVSLTFAPIFVVLTSSDAIASELATGSVRFAIFRTDRASWAFGKLLGQAALLFAGIALGGVAAWITGWIRLSSFEPLHTAIYTARFAATSFCHAFAYLGLALGVSQLTRSTPWSRALGLLALIGLFAAYQALNDDDVVAAAPVVSGSLQMLLPAAHRLDLWRTSFGDVAPSAAILLALGATYFMLGHLRFARRDA